MLKLLDIVSSEGVVDVWEVLGVRDGEFRGDGGRGEGGSRGAGGMGGREFLRLT